MTWFLKDSDNALGHDSKPGALESTMHWQVIWPRAIALAWEDPGFHAQLKADPRTAIREKFGYHLMDDLDLTIEDAPEDARFDPKQATNSPDEERDPWAALPHMKLTLCIPPAPPVELQGIAITSYQDTGRTYPFSCC
ncbi:BMA_0021/BMA_0022 family TOMM bacteriocin [Sedimentitalea sp. XS_ASV28]|uniref:BMA_0021/BMA_0022 family TOMM bacteriocin n=1 Tax=Sedimentitalea sp. XS_ASV28 TaxID=3241296 RepID=UPI003516D460